MDKFDKEAIDDLTEIVYEQNKVIKKLKERVDYLERYAKMRRPTQMEAMGDLFRSGLRHAMGG